MSPTSSQHHPPSTATLNGVTDKPVLYASSDRNVKHTYASYRRESIPELDSHIDSTDHLVTGEHAQDLGVTPKPQNLKTWSLCIPIPLPPPTSSSGLHNLSLESLMYDISYTSLKVGLSVSGQTDILLSNDTETAQGILTHPSENLAFYSYDNDSGGHQSNHDDSMMEYRQPVFRGPGVLLNSKSSSEDADTIGWCRYVDHQRIYPNARIGGDTHSDGTSTGTPSTSHCFDHLYLFFHVSENSDAEVSRSINVDVVATWNDSGSEQDVEVEKLDKGKGIERPKYEVKEDVVREAVSRMESERREMEERDRMIAERLAREERDYLMAARFANEEQSRRAAHVIAREEALKLSEREQAYRMERLQDAYRKEVERRSIEEAVRRSKAQKTGSKGFMGIFRKRPNQNQEMVEKHRPEDTQRDLTAVYTTAEREAQRKARVMVEQQCRVLEEADRRARKELRRGGQVRREGTAVTERTHLAPGENAERLRELEERGKFTMPTTIKDAAMNAEGPLAERIKVVVESKHDSCSYGYGWMKTHRGYWCGVAGGTTHDHHFVSFSELGL